MQLDLLIMRGNPQQIIGSSLRTHLKSYYKQDLLGWLPQCATADFSENPKEWFELVESVMDSEVRYPVKAFLAHLLLAQVPCALGQLAVSPKKVTDALQSMVEVFSYQLSSLSDLDVTYDNEQKKLSLEAVNEWRKVFKLKPLQVNTMKLDSKSPFP